MKRQFERRIDDLRWQQLRSEYLDLLLLAGRLAVTQHKEKTPPLADDIRRYTRTKLQNCRDIASVTRIADAGRGVADVEMSVVHFLDSAARDHFGNWRPVHTELGDEYRYAAQTEHFELGKYIDSKLEDLRTSASRLTDESDELLETFDQCLRLGYKGSYEERPDVLQNLQNAIARELSRRSGGTGLSGILPPIPPRRRTVLNITTKGVIICAIVVVLVNALMLRLAVWSKTETVSESVDSFVGELLKNAEITHRECRAPTEGKQ